MLLILDKMVTRMKGEMEIVMIRGVSKTYFKIKSKIMFELYKLDYNDTIGQADGWM